MGHFSLQSWGLDSRKYKPIERTLGACVWLYYFLLAFVAFSLIDINRAVDFVHHQEMPAYNPHLLLAVGYFLWVVGGLLGANFYRIKYSTGNLYITSICTAAFLGTLLASLVEFSIQMFFAKIYIDKTDYDFSIYMHHFWIAFWPEYLIILTLLILVLLLRWRMRVYKLSIQRDAKNTSGNLGSARMADEKDITRYGLRGEQGGLIGKDSRGPLRLPELTDRLILGFRGYGKTSALLIPFILDYLQTNKFMTDIKGELSAVTAKRAANAGREVFIIDPFCVLKNNGITIKTHTLNPLAYIKNDEPLERDRYISALAAALCSTDHVPRTETELHFSENAQIILEGILDFYTLKFKDKANEMNLVSLHDWWLAVVTDEKNKVIKEMKQSSHKARAAAAQLFSAGKDESGSMKTTVYRQLQWLRNENIRNVFRDDEVAIDSFIYGDCDIYVVLPEDMVKSYSRMVRVVLALIKVKIIQAPAKKLKQNYCFVLDELGQFGYCPDVEQMVNSMRSRGVKVLAAFQTIDQIDSYKDQTVFKAMPVKHFLGGDDLKTLEWIQKLGDKRTVLIENVSRNTSTTAKGGRPTISESYSASETQTDLIHLNDIREMSEREQYIFIKGLPVIRCQKAYYYEEEIYKGRYDKNPLEERAST